jgi:hypothetical protein
VFDRDLDHSPRCRHRNHANMSGCRDGNLQHMVSPRESCATGRFHGIGALVSERFVGSADIAVWLRWRTSDGSRPHARRSLHPSVPVQGRGLYLNLEEFSGLRSQGMSHLHLHGHAVIPTVRRYPSRPPLFRVYSDEGISLNYSPHSVRIIEAN